MPFGSKRGRTAAALLALAFGAMFPSLATAGTGMQTSVPAGPVKNGLRVNVDSSWVDANGYRPIQVELIPCVGAIPAPATADRSIRVEIRPYSWRGGFGWCGVSDFVEIHQGDTSVKTTVAVPQREQWSTFQVEFWEDGRKLEDLAFSGAMSYTGNYGWTEAAPAMLFIDRDAPIRSQRMNRITELNIAGSKGKSYNLPDARGLAEGYPPPDLTQRGYDPSERATDLDILEALKGWSKIELLPPSDLPTRWIEFTGFDFIFVSLDDFAAMKEENPSSWQAIRDLIATGPTLCVYGVGEDFARLQEVELLLDMPPNNDAEKDPYRGWLTPQTQKYSRHINEVQPSQNPYYYSQQAQQTPDPKTEQAMNAAEGKAPSKPTFVWRNVDLGRVVALGPEDPFPGRPQDWGWVFNTLDSNDWMWRQRHGLSLNRRNFDYWNFLVPGVGLAPVNTFLILISLFVVVIGPLNYWFLVRHGRLYLLLVTVPAGALAVTMSLFTFALLTEGLGTKARVRSYTEIDQRRGRSVSWSRQSYYAALTPSRGFNFPKTAAVYPIETQPAEQPNYYRPKCTIDWEEDQTLARGYISARVTAQMMVIQARETTAKLDIQEGAGPPEATNALGTEIEFLVLRDSDGKFFLAENVAEGKKAALAPGEWSAAVGRIRKALAAVTPKNPEGYDPREYNEALNFGQSNVYWWGGDIDSGVGDPTVNSSILERSLREIVSPSADTLPPRGYIALVKQSPEVPLGVAKAKYEASIHVIVGRW